MYIAHLPSGEPLPRTHMNYCSAPLLLCISERCAHTQGDLQLMFRIRKPFLAIHFSHFICSVFINNKAALHLYLSYSLPNVLTGSEHVWRGAGILY